MKVGVIGGGNWGKNLIRTLNAMGVLGGVAEGRAEAREALQAEYPEIPFFATHGELLDSGIGAVSIVTPAETHFELTKEALEKGLDVCVEKPMVLSGAHADELNRLAKDQERILMVGHLLLYQPAVQWIHKALGEGLIGEAFSFHQERLNLGRARSVENVLWSFGVHDIAVLLFLSGAEPRRTQFSGKAGLQRGIEDDTYIHLEFSNGSLGHIHSSWLWPELRRMLTIVGSKGMIVYDEVAQKVTLHKKTIDSELKNVNDGSEVVFEGAGEPLRLEMEHFVECCRTRRTPDSDGVSAAYVIRVMEEADRIKESLAAALVQSV